MSEEPRYTLDEAAAELRRRQCVISGHSWRVLERFGSVPVQVICEQCGKAHDVAGDGGSAQPEEREPHIVDRRRGHFGGPRD